MNDSFDSNNQVRTRACIPSHVYTGSLFNSKQAYQIYVNRRQTGRWFDTPVLHLSNVKQAAGSYACLNI